MAIDFKESISDPISRDIGNIAIQSNVVSKTIQLGLFTTNENAVWAANNQLQKESFPFAQVSCIVNRSMFRLQVGDVFLYTYPLHGVSNMVCRVLRIEEESLESENIIVHASQDVFSISNSITQYSIPEDNAIPPLTYETEPFINLKIFEAPYVLSGETSIIIVAGKVNQLDSGFSIYMSVDDGGSYTLIETSTNIQSYGTLEDDYGITYTIDGYEGFIIDFESDVNIIETVTWADIYSGNKNTAMLGDEMISFRSITPISGTLYKIEDVIRGRFGTVKKEHTAGEDFWFIKNSISLVSGSEIIPGADRKFKLVPYNIKSSGNIAEAQVISLSIEGESSKPYEPINFNANGESFNPLYVSGTDITLDWSVRKRGEGCGIGIPGAAIVPGTDYEGLFKIEVYVSSSLVRTATDIDAATWDYTNSMNISDNGTPANEITFLIYNYIESGMIFVSDSVQVICNKE